METLETTAETVHNATSNPFKRRSESTITDASRQWATRPPEQAVHSVEDLLNRTGRRRERSVEKDGIAWNTLQVQACGEDLCLVGKGGVPAKLTNWCAGQIARVAGAPHGYLSKLPVELAAQCLTHGLDSREATGNQAQGLFLKEDNGLTLRALTSERYARIWDCEIAQRVALLCENGTWGPAEAFRRAEGAGDVRHAWGDRTSLPLGWVGDRNMFLALIDYEGGVKVGDTKLARFVLLSNSEVGAASIKVTFGLLDFVCCNFMLWGCQEVYEASFRHIGDIREKWGQIAGTMSRNLSSGERETITDQIKLAQNYVLGDTEKQTVARGAAATGLPLKIVKEARKRAVQTPRYGNPDSVWGLYNGLTEASQHRADHVDRRVEIDLAAARLMNLI